MDLDQILIANPVSDDLMCTARYFNSLCDAITRITEDENDVFFADDILVDVGLSARKAALLEDFEDHADALFELLKAKAPLNATLQRYFITRLERLQSILRVNTSLQLHAMGRVQAALSGQERIEQCH
ncbi:MAG: hypothetical protein ACRBCT_00295 [Alphaproteobacteria bacterium]